MNKIININGSFDNSIENNSYKAYERLGVFIDCLMQLESVPEINTLLDEMCQCHEKMYNNYYKSWEAFGELE